MEKRLGKQGFFVCTKIFIGIVSKISNDNIWKQIQTTGVKPLGGVFINVQNTKIVIEFLFCSKTCQGDRNPIVFDFAKSQLGLV